MKLKFTPGPWYTRHGQISSETSTHGCTIANCNKTSRGISDAEVEANALLIAAAPELVTALTAAMSALRSYQYGNASPDLAEEVAELARMTLEKAGVQ